MHVSWFHIRSPSFSSSSSYSSSPPSGFSSRSSGQDPAALSDMARQVRSALKHDRARPACLREEFAAWLDGDVGSYDLGTRRGVDRYVNLRPGLRREVQMNVRRLYALVVESCDGGGDSDEIAQRIDRLRAVHSPGRRARGVSDASAEGGGAAAAVALSSESESEPEVEGLERWQSLLRPTSADD